MVDKPTRIFNSDDLAMLSRVLEEAVNATIDGVDLTQLEMEELSSRLGKVLMDRFTAGETDPERLKAIAVESVRQQ
jgi:FtsZ-binding cell division protein ZapB